MAFLAFTSAQMDADSGWTETVTQLIRTNFDDLNSRASALEVGRAVHEAIVTDFAVEALDADDWDSGAMATGGNLTLGLPAADDSIISLNSTATAATGYGIAASTKRMRVGTTRDQVIVIEWRTKETGNAQTFFMGLQDATKVFTTAGVDAVTQMCGFITGTSGTKYNFRISNGGGNTIVADVGNRANYEVFKMVLTRSTTWSVDVTIDGTPISGSPFTANFPTVVLRPYFANYRGVGGVGAEVYDYIYCYWTTRPAAV